MPHPDRFELLVDGEAREALERVASAYAVERGLRVTPALRRQVACIALLTMLQRLDREYAATVGVELLAAAARHRTRDADA